MTFCIITHVNHYKLNNQFFAYAPYVREMNIWLKHVDQVLVVAPICKSIQTQIDISYDSQNITFREVSKFELTSIFQIASTIYKLPRIIYNVFTAMKSSNHIHLRCPGNMGLIGCIVQIFFPNKKKTAKYAGNWDPKSKQPWSYRLQKWILNSTFLTKNMQVLVYGNWPKSTKNIKPFFTASYFQNEIVPIQNLDHEKTIRFVFAGSLVKGKNPQYTLELIKQLKEKLPQVQLDIYGDGILKTELQHYIEENNLQNEVYLHGNQNAAVLKKAFQTGHFVVLPSRSEGWPKAIAEGMFWGCVPLATAVSCVPEMLNNGTRGLLLSLNLEEDTATIVNLIKNNTHLQMMRQEAAQWSRIYTLDYFENEVKKILTR